MAENSTQNSNKGERLAGYRFKPGQSAVVLGGNPITELYERILADPKNLATLEKSVLKVLTRGSMALVLLLREITDRAEGKIVQSIEADMTVNLAELIAAGRKRAAERSANNSRG